MNKLGQGEYFVEKPPHTHFQSAPVPSSRMHGKLLTTQVDQKAYSCQILQIFSTYAILSHLRYEFRRTKNRTVRKRITLLFVRSIQNVYLMKHLDPYSARFGLC
ncbi:hypothetical protein RF11_06523 [Thelohanellus kitauei]|uniref:Uncharacterized protein n=1 Tax=Thelohanellus kitauei TaxID=669202 RepID=A0A0C2MZG6_THEKT|nr:hypothetical protein RF11_06523 [Thelohanellus kitauei]